MAFVFLLSLCGFFAVIVMALRPHHPPHVPPKGSDSQAGEHVASNEHSRGTGQETPIDKNLYKKSLIEAGSFQIQLTPSAGAPPTGEVQDLATIDVVLLCDSSETGEWMKQALPKVRNILINIFLTTEREELMSPLGKKKLKIHITKKLNEWLPKGHIEDIFFSKLILN